MSTGQKLLSGIILGVAVGAAILLLTKTDAGQDFLSDLGDATDDLKGKAKDKLSDAKDTFQDKYSSLGKDLKSLIKKGKAFIEDLEDKAKSIAG